MDVASNRTKVELKLLFLHLRQIEQKTSNRTKVELKHDHGYILLTYSALLIVPKWN